MDILFRLSSRPILDTDGSVLVSLHTDICKDILLAKSAALSSCNTHYNISRSAQYSRLSWLGWDRKALLVQPQFLASPAISLYRPLYQSSIRNIASPVQPLPQAARPNHCHIILTCLSLYMQYCIVYSISGISAL